jgi:hypothetical protein
MDGGAGSQSGVQLLGRGGVLQLLTKRFLSAMTSIMRPGATAP